MPKVAIARQKLIESEDLISLIGKDVESIRCILLDSAYKEEIQDLPAKKTNAILFEKALRKNYVKTLEGIIRFSSGNIRKLMHALLRKVELSNLKTVLRAIKYKIDVDEALKNVVPVGTFGEEKYREIILKSKSFEDLEIAFSNHDFELILRQFSGTDLMSEDLVSIETKMDKAVFQRIIDLIDRLGDSDRKIAQKLFWSELDSINIKVILKIKALEISPKQIREYLVPTGFFDVEILGEAFLGSNIESVLKHLLDFAEKNQNKFYQKSLSRILAQPELSISSIEDALYEMAYKESMELLKEYSRYYNIGFILEYNNLKRIEIKNLICIILGSERKLTPQTIRKHLIL